MQVFRHHLYEYSKGLRRMILHTTTRENKKEIEEILTKRGISYLVQEVNTEKFNIFFGNPVCIDVVKSFVNRPLNMLSDEEDFILGTLLGYDLTVQCRRYLSRKEPSLRSLAG